MAAVAGFHIEAIFNPSIEGPQTAFWLWTVAGLGMYLTVLSRPSRAARADDAWQLDAEALESDLATLSRASAR